MAVEITATDATFVGTGVSSTYSPDFYANSSGQVVVTVDGVVQTLGDDYVINGLGDADGVDIVGNFAAASVVYIERVTPITQEVDTQNNETILEDVLDSAFDKLTMIAQELSGKTDRAILVPKGEAGLDLPSAADRANYFLAFNALGQLILSVGTGADAGLRGALGAITGLGAALVTWINTGVGAVFRLVQDKLRDTVSVKDFGAVGDGIVDDLAAMQAAHNTGKLVYYPPGTYKFSGQVTIAAGGIIGAGKTLTNLNCTDVSANAAIKFTGPYTTLPGGLVSGNPTFRDFTLNGNLLKATGAGIQLESATNEVSYASFRSIGVSYFPINIDFVKASLWKMIDCDILGHTIAGVRINNTFDNDAGDAAIMGCVINTTVVTADNILHLSSGGLKIVGNKLLGGRHGYSMQYTGAGNTSVLIIANNSIENFSGQAITFAKVSAGLTEFINVHITGNEISVSLAASPAFLIVNDGGTWLKVVNITGNIIQLPGVANSFGIAFSGVTTLTISGNTFRGNGLNSQAIALTSCVDALIGPNTYSNIAVPYSLITPGANNLVYYDGYKGTAAAVPSAVATTIFTLPALEAGAHYSMSAGIFNAGGANNSTVRIGCDGLVYFVPGGEVMAASVAISFAGLNVRVTQNTGIPQDINWSWRRIA